MKNEEGIEFEVEEAKNASSGADDKVSNESMRHIFRVPVSESHGVKARLGGRRYDVINLEKRGIAIRLPKGAKPFGTGDILPSIELTFRDRVLNLRGKVVHVSYDEKKSPVCGLNFIDLDEESELRIVEFYRHLRKEMFSKT